MVVGSVSVTVLSKTAVAKATEMNVALAVDFDVEVEKALKRAPYSMQYVLLCSFK